MEVGAYVSAMKGLSQVEEQFGDITSDYVIYKYYQLMGKVCSRAFYFEKGYRCLLKGLDKFDDGSKAAVKLNESMANILVEPMWFDEAESYLKKAEKILEN